MSTPLSPDNAAELETWEPLAPAEMTAMGSLWGEEPAETSDAA